MKTRENKRMVKLDGFLFIFPQNYPFWTCILEKISTFIFWCMIIPLGPRLVYT